MNRAYLAAFALVALLAISPGWPDEPSAYRVLQADVARLVIAAQKRSILWPWQPPEPEVAVVASHGKAIAPLLVELLVENPESIEGANLHVQQHAALALCKIYGVPEGGGHVYMNRALSEENSKVKAFWSAKVAE